MAVLVVLGLLPGPEAGDPPLPFPLDQKDPDLQRSLAEAVANAGGRDLARNGRLSVALVNLAAGGGPRYAGLNDRGMVYAAGLPKLAVLLASFQTIEEGRLRESPALRGDLARMIRPSSNGARAHQVARFFTLLDRGRLVSPEKSREMKRILSRPGIAHKLVARLDGRSDVHIYRKSGTWRRWHADAAIVENGTGRYVAVVLAQSREGAELLARLIRELDGAMRSDDAATRTADAILFHP